MISSTSTLNYILKDPKHRTKASLTIISNPKFKFFSTHLKSLETGSMKPVIVDCGCASGHLISLLHKKYDKYRFVGCDINKELIDEAKHDNLSMQFYNIDILEMPFTPQTIDAFLCSSILHELYSHYKKHYSFKPLNILFKKIYLALKRDGLLLIRDPVCPCSPLKNLIFTPKDDNGEDFPKTKKDLMSADTSRLSTKNLLIRFLFDFSLAKPFLTRKHYSYSFLKNSTSYKLPIWLINEFIKHRPYVKNNLAWKEEIKEKYGVFTARSIAKFARKHKFSIKKIFSSFDREHQSAQFLDEYKIEEPQGIKVDLADKFHTHFCAVLRKK